MYPIQTARLRFRTGSVNDMPLAMGLWGDEQVTASIGGPFNEEKVRQRLEAEIALQSEHGVQYWPIFLKENGSHVGCCGLRPYKIAEGIFEIGFHLRPEHWKKGLA